MIELDELRDAARKAFPADKLTPDRDNAWQTMTDMGWLMMELPEALGGLGLNREASIAIHFELGRVLSSAPLIPGLLGLRSIALSDRLANRQDWIDRLCGGEYVPLHLLSSSVEAAADGTYNGTIPGIMEADMASHVIASLPGIYALVPLAHPGVTLTPKPTWDQSRNLFEIELSEFAPDPRLILAEGLAAKEMHDSLSCAAQLAMAADSLGGANAALEATVDYLKLRKQFDRPLAMFQALKHRCADLMVEIAATEALLWSRARDEAAGLADAGALNARAREVYALVTEEMIQLHGGIGLTAEHPCHLFMKRAMLNLNLCGTPDLWNEHVGWDALSRMV